MKPDLKKLIITNLPYLLFVWLFGKMGEAWRLAAGADASQKMLHFMDSLAAAFANGLPCFHLFDLCIGIAGAVLVRLAVYLKGKNAKKYRHGMEYGSARWGGPKDIAPYIDPVFENNILLTQTERLTMNGRPKDPKTARNKNVLVIGGSGSGKTRFFVKPNLMQMHSSYCITDPNGVMIVESTANGLNHFSELWTKAENGENMYQPHFYGWVQDKKMFATEYEMFCDRYKRINGKLPESNELDEQEQALMQQSASMEQLVWRRMKIANSSLEQFRQEFPSCPIEAFVSTGKNFFNTSLIADRAAHIRPSIAAPEQFKGNNSLTFWRLPEAGKRYFLGVDVAEGIGEDASCIEIVDVDGYQCAELLSNTIKPYRLAEILLELARYYNSGHCVIEKASAGHVVVDKMRNEYHYPNLYKSKQYDVTGRVKRKPGWETTPRSRPIMLTDFSEAFDKGEIWINSKVLYSQMKLFSGRVEHTGRTGDDAVIAFALALQGKKSARWYID